MKAMTNRTNIINANSLHTVESLRRWASCCFSQPVSHMLATVLKWLTDFLTGAIMESRKAARSKDVASPPPGSTWWFFYYQKRDMTSSFTWSESFGDFGSFLKYIFCRKLASFCCFSLQIFTLSYPWVIIIPFSKQKQTKTEPGPSCSKLG